MGRVGAIHCFARQEQSTWQYTNECQRSHAGTVVDVSEGAARTATPVIQEPVSITLALARRIEIWPVDRLVPYSRNARTHSPDLRKTGADVKFLSLEPLLGPLPQLNLRSIDWVIVGGESGPCVRPMNPDWVQQDYQSTVEPFPILAPTPA
jgi:hypothetical protein